MNKQQAIVSILRISSGTMAGLIGNNTYDAVDAATARIVEWIEAQPDTRRWPTWMEVWEEYRGQEEIQPNLCPERVPVP